MRDEKSPKEDGKIKDPVEGAEINLVDDEDAPLEPPFDEISGDSVDDDLASVETQIYELKDALLRSQADLQNVRRRAERDLENAHKYAVEKFVKDLLPVLDSMDRALQLAETTEGFDSSMLEGMKMTHKLLVDTAVKHGIEPIDPVGSPFDPNQHQAMSMVESDEQEANTVVAVMQKGYKLEGRVMRPAMVVVSKIPGN